MKIEPTEYEPFDGDYIDADYTRLINDIQIGTGAPFGAYREICVSLEDDNLVEILFSDDDGANWDRENSYPVPDGWTVEQLRPMFAGYPVYLKTDEYKPDIGGWLTDW